MSSRPNQGHDGMIAACGLLFLICIVWFFFQETIAAFSVQLAFFVLNVLEFLLQSGSVGHFFASILVPGTNSDSLILTQNMVYRADPSRMTVMETIAYLNLAGKPLRILIIPIVCFIIYKMFSIQKAARLKAVYSADTLADKVKSFHPHLYPVLLEDLTYKDPDVGNSARALSPISFAIKHELINVHDTDYQGQNLSRFTRATFDKSKQGQPGYTVLERDLEGSISKIHGRCRLDYEKAREVFINQLGPRYTGLDNLSLPRKVMFTLFSIYLKGGDANKKKVFESFDHLNRSWNKKELSTGKYIDVKYVQKLIDETDFSVAKSYEDLHAYELTILPAMLRGAREKGKLWTNCFYWVKLVDRPLWYALHQEGGESAWAEASASRSHLLVETLFQVPIHEPSINGAVKALEFFLDETEGWTPAKQIKEDEYE